METNYFQSLADPQLQEGWLTNYFNQQDFCEGAKGLNSLQPVSSSSPLHNASTYDEWMELNGTLGCNDFEPFNAVLLPETKDFGPDFFGDVDQVLLPENKIGFNELRISDGLYGTDNIYTNRQTESVVPSKKPKITTIKLKKVKIPKKKRVFKNDFQAFDYEVASIPSETEGMDFFEQEKNFMEPSQSVNSFLLSTPFEQHDCEIDKLFSDDYINFDNYSQETEEPNTSTVLSNLTLKEAITMENADILLDAYLSPDRTSISSDSPQELSENLSFQENIFSPGSSSHYSFSDCVPSPLSSLDDNSFDVSFTADTQILDSNDLGNKTQSGRRGRKPRQKMTPESKYLRKKEQNKQAALRYRAKKKLEDEHMMLTLKDEEDRNNKLKKEWKNLSQEYKFMKKLVKESLIARTLVSPN